MANKVGEKIREARTNAGMTMTALAEYVDNVSAADIGKAEKGEKELSQAALKQIAKATGVTQKSLLEAAAASTYGNAKKTTTKSTSKTATKSSKTTAKSSSKSSAKEEIKLTAAEKTLVELYRAADKDTKAKAVSVLKGEETSFISELLNGVTGGSSSSKSTKKSSSKQEESGVGAILGEFLKGL